ncbi:MAG TPA: tRNA (adenosine(37)-N6)-dimethylallyltransferase MiaA [Hyphomicrobium sp.]|nr:tRNA (adenosine(37)-N6)-dimethylallyltransferase MiaA [Hyphomicrobium sp.]
MKKLPRVVLIAGPTASGKSGLALSLAEELGGMVINADSMQVYRELRVLTARPSVADEARAPHALYGCVAGSEAYSAGRYVADAKRALGEAEESGRLPIFVGGTGLYFKALVEGLSPIPPVADDVRAFWRSEAAEKGTAHVFAQLTARDSEMAGRLSPGDTQRIVRALEVVDSTGQSLAEWQRLPREPVLDLAETLPLLVMPERAERVARIDRRFDAMIGMGALDEVLQLDGLGLDPQLPIMGALGVGPLRRHLAGALSLEGAIEAGKAETRQYAKRQATWARGNMLAWKRFDAQEMEIERDKIVRFMKHGH